MKDWKILIVKLDGEYLVDYTNDDPQRYCDARGLTLVEIKAAPSLGDNSSKRLARFVLTLGMKSDLVKNLLTFARNVGDIIFQAGYQAGYDVGRDDQRQIR